MSCFVVSLFLFAGAAAIAIADDRRLLSWLASVIPAVMLLVGVEILLTSFSNRTGRRFPATCRGRRSTVGCSGS